MPKTVNREANDLLAAVTHEMESGAFDAAVEQRRALLAQLEARVFSPERQLEAQIRFCRLALPWLDLKGVARAMHPYLGPSAQEGKFSVDHAALERCETDHGACLAGLLYAEVCNALYRTFQYDESEQWGARAVALLVPPRQECPGFSKLSVAVGAVLAHAWYARPRWQKARPRTGPARQEIIDGLKQQMAVLDTLAGSGAAGEVPSPLVNQAYAILCDLTADFEYSSGRVSLAEDLAQRALLVLGDGVRDSARSGHLLYLVGKVKSGRVEQNRYDFAMRLFQRAYAAYKALEPWHPFRFRCQVHIIRCLIREERLETAAAKIEEARQELASSELEPGEGRFNRFHIDLTELWIVERKARAAKNWDQALKHAHALLPRAPEMGMRLHSETLFHLGLALGHTGDIEGARSRLNEARELGMDGGQPSLEIAAELALAEVLSNQDRSYALECLARAKEGLRTRARSAFLSRWSQSLEEELERPFVIEVAQDATYQEAEQALKRAYLRYHAHRVYRLGEKLQFLVQRTGIARSTLLRWFAEIGEEDILEDLGLMTPRKK